MSQTRNIAFTCRFDDRIHDSEIRTDTNRPIQIGCGPDIFQDPIARLRIGSANI